MNSNSLYFTDNVLELAEEMLNLQWTIEFFDGLDTSPANVVFEEFVDMGETILVEEEIDTGKLSKKLGRNVSSREVRALSQSAKRIRGQGIDPKTAAKLAMKTMKDGPSTETSDKSASQSPQQPTTKPSTAQQAMKHGLQSVMGSGGSSRVSGPETPSQSPSAGGESEPIRTRPSSETPAQGIRNRAMGFLGSPTGRGLVGDFAVGALAGHGGIKGRIKTGLKTAAIGAFSRPGSIQGILRGVGGGLKRYRA